MQGIVRNRMKIEGAVASARAWLEIMEKGAGFSPFLWDFVEGKPIVNRYKTMGEIPAETEISRIISKELKAQRLQILRPDDHLRLHAGDRHGQRPPDRLPAPRGLRKAWPDAI